MGSKLFFRYKTGNTQHKGPKPTVLPHANSDDELVLRTGRGDRLAASELVLRHTDNVMAVCYRMLNDRSAAEDLTQETFLKLWKKASKWEAGNAKISTWLYRVAVNACLDRLRKEGRELPEDAAPERIDQSPQADAVLAASETRAVVEDALAKLPDRQRQAIILCHYQELSNTEAADILDTSVEAIESLLSRGRRTLRKQLSGVRHELLGS